MTDYNPNTPEIGDYIVFMHGNYCRDGYVLIAEKDRVKIHGYTKNYWMSMTRFMRIKKEMLDKISEMQKGKN